MAACGGANLTSAQVGDALAGPITTDARSWNSSLQVRAAYKLNIGWISANLAVTNVGPDTLRGLQSNDFQTFLLRAYADSTRSGTPLWRSEDHGSNGIAIVGGGPLVLVPGRTLGDTLTKSGLGPLPADASSLIGPTPKTYYMGVVLQLKEPNLTTRVFPAGTLTLGGK